MNWEVAKNWLIVAFLILDTILGWQVVESRKQLVGYAESYSDLLANTKTMLAEHGLILNTTPPSSHPNLPVLQADAANPTFGELLGAAFPKAQTSYVVDAENGLARSSDGTAKLMDKGVWVIRYDVPPSLASDNQSDLLNFVWHGSDYAYDADESRPDDAASSHSGQLTFDRKYNDTWVFDADVVAVVSNNKLLGYEQTALTDFRTVGDAKPTISALDALDNLANTVDKSTLHKDNKILSIRLGYIHKAANPATAGPIAAPNYWFPVWRVETTQQTYYVNAFSGEVDTAP